MDIELSVDLTPIEMTYLARLLGADMLVGIGDPFFGWLTEEIKEAWERAKGSLAEKGAVQVKEDGAVIVDVLAGGVIAVCARPDTTFLIHNKPYKEGGESRVFHVTPKLCVEHPFPGDPELEIKLNLYNDPFAGLSKLEELAAIESGAGKDGDSFTTTMEKLWRVMAEVEKEEKDIGDVLSRAGIKGKASRLLSPTLGSPFQLSNLLRVELVEGDWQIEGLAFLGGKELWKISPDMQSKHIRVQVAACGREQAIKAIKGFLKGPLTA